ncbi:hypothetical protein KTT_50240 [Tengunoibacter tsumagoiensis]|uniref:Uncharacterized protein n=1 Tax=Tengunoibacter tsumagoiensis TaxID=2014871 RepID=A0A402A837_9CHLR|nr:hypothetical protein KTT_50240 [Tengunoibacter tsumagoiensis]
MGSISESNSLAIFTTVLWIGNNPMGNRSQWSVLQAHREELDAGSPQYWETGKCGL